MHQAIQPALHEEQDEEKKATDVYGGVAEVQDLEGGGRISDPHCIYENIPEGIDPRYIREEKIVRGLSQRHIQVRYLTLLRIPFNDDR